MCGWCTRPVSETVSPVDEVEDDTAWVVTTDETSPPVSTVNGSDGDGCTVEGADGRRRGRGESPDHWRGPGDTRYNKPPTIRVIQYVKRGTIFSQS